MKYDVVVVGAGAAGLSAAQLLARSLRTVAIVDSGTPRNSVATHLHGFLSKDGSTPDHLLEVGRDEFVSYGGQLLKARVETAERTETGFDVHCDGDLTLSARAVIVATGLRDVLPDIAGAREHWGSTVLHCPYCHGYEVRNQPLAVVGGDNRPFTLDQATLIRQWSSDVSFFPNRFTLTAEERSRITARGVRIVTGEVERLNSDGVTLADGTSYPCAAVFVGPRADPLDDLLTDLGCERDEDDWVTTDPTGRSSVDGVWAAGNVCDPSAHLINAAAAGSQAGIAVNQFLLDSDELTGV